ncbi:hypothetical protein GPECTOR_95g670 [Gonium pectorale]|uniref:Uncharacterized protein n=1 Tax=Gonium pectorale TaxID=33097 RepID=A0A150G0D4_GONPE|nr:hypothetical protein GPECTOR_95g670 [Gonium pectorale]|eukprot:KXZ43281.1 hypothetical protein GPECTOR_95g670 [Gonium pectorale]
MASGHERAETALEDVLQALCARGRDVLLGSLQAPVAGNQGSISGRGDVAAQAALAAARLACQALRDFIDGSITSATLRLGEATESLLDLGPPPLHRWPLASQVTLITSTSEWLNNARAAELLPRVFSHVPLADRRRITALEVSFCSRLWSLADGTEAMARAIRELPALQRVRLWPELPRVPGEERPLVESLESLRDLNDLTLRIGPGPGLPPLLQSDSLRRLDLWIAGVGSISTAAAASLRCMSGLEELTLRGVYGMASVMTAVAALPPSLSALHFKDTHMFDSEHLLYPPGGGVTFELEDGGAVGLHAEYLRLGVLEELRQHCGAFLQPLRCIRVTGELVFGWDWDHQHHPYPPLDDDDVDPDAAVQADGDGSPEARMLEHLLRQHELTLDARTVFIVSAVVPLDRVRGLLSRVAGMEGLSLALQVVYDDYRPPEVEHKLSVGISAEAQAAATWWPMQPQEGGAGGSPAGGGVVQVGAASAPAPDLSLYDLAVEQMRAEAAEERVYMLTGYSKERVYTTAFVQCINKAAQRVMDGWGPAADWTGRQRLDWLLEQWAALRIEVEGPPDFNDLYEPEYGDGWGTDSYSMSD